MALSKVTRAKKARPRYDLNQEGANALLATTIDFLLQNDIPKRTILAYIEQYCERRQRSRGLRTYRELEKAQEDMGLLISTWFSHPKFLDENGNPVPLTVGRGAKSISQLIRTSGAKIQPNVAIGLMRQSLSVTVTDGGKLIARRRTFVLPKLEVLRAAFVIERYLDTLSQIAAGQMPDTRLLLERSCHVSEVDLKKIIPLLRDIESRGTAFIDSIDGDLEVRRLRNAKRKNVGELGVHVFLWTKPAEKKMPHSEVKRNILTAKVSLGKKNGCRT